MILEYFSLGKGSFTKPWGRLEQFLPFCFRIITSYLKMSGMPCNREQVINALQVSHFYLFLSLLQINVAFRENECTKINKYSIYIVWVQFGQRSERVSDCCLTPNEQYHGKSKLIFNEIMMRSALY
jgi:hypothetical protein